MDSDLDEREVEAAVEFLNRYGFVETVIEEAQSATGASLTEALLAILRRVNVIARNAGVDTALISLESSPPAIDDAKPELMPAPQP